MNDNTKHNTTPLKFITGVEGNFENLTLHPVFSTFREKKRPLKFESGSLICHYCLLMMFLIRGSCGHITNFTSGAVHASFDARGKKKKKTKKLANANATG